MSKPADAISVINDLSASQKRGLLKKHLGPELLPLESTICRSTSTGPICSFK